MNSAQVLTHPAFDRPPVVNARRRGPTPRGIPMLRREQRERRDELGESARQCRKLIAQLEHFIQMTVEIADEVGLLIRQVGNGADCAAYVVLAEALERAYDMSAVLLERQPQPEN